MVTLLCFKKFLKLTILCQAFLLVSREKLLLKQNKFKAGVVLHSIGFKQVLLHLKNVLEIFKKFQEIWKSNNKPISIKGLNWKWYICCNYKNLRDRAYLEAADKRWPMTKMKRKFPKEEMLMFVLFYKIVSKGKVFLIWTKKQFAWILKRKQLAPLFMRTLYLKFSWSMGYWSGLPSD